MILNKKNIPVFILLIIIFVYGCQKDFSTENNNQNISILNSTSIEGRVTDETGLPIFGASVKAGINSTQTDKNGMFKFSNASFSTVENFVTVSKTGFFKGSRTFFARVNSNNFVRIQLLKKSISGRLNASAGGDVDTRGNGGSVHFEPNSFVTASGTIYNGTVLVSTQYLNPTSADISDQMPGDLRGTSTTGTTVGLKSYGMLAVEITDNAGQKLQLKTGLPATLTVNIPASILATAPATIPLWYFNDSTGLWKQEGSAIKTGDNYIGTVNHFSFWNCDDPFEYVKIKAHVINNAGLPVAAAKVKIISASGASAYDYTDNNGYVDGFVPKNEVLVIQILNTCGLPAYSANIGPFNVLTDLGNITITQNTTTIYGTAVSCTNTAVTDGYVQVTLNGSTGFAGIINGSFSYTFLNCNNSTTAQLLAVDNGTLKQGNNITITLSSNNVNAGILTACGVSANTFFNLIVNGVSISANTSEYTRLGWKDTSSYQNGNVDYTYAAYFFDSTTEKYTYLNLNLPPNQIFNVPSNYSFESFGYAGINGNSSQIDLEPLLNTQTMTFTEYGSLGQFISGNFSGQVQRNIRDTGFNQPTIIDTVNASFNFRVRHSTYPF